MLGIKIKSVKTQNAYTIEEFYDAIKDVPFSAGKPELTKHGLTTLITFPPLGLNNQVQILPAQFQEPYTKWTIQKNKPAGMDNFLVNSTLDTLTDGYSSLTTVIGSKAKTTEQLVDATVEEINALGL